jgi:hypothetical protein
MKLIDDWRKAWRWFSVQAMVLAGALQAAWLAVPDDLKQGWLTDGYATMATIVLLFLGTVGRLVDQPKG